MHKIANARKMLCRLRCCTEWEATSKWILGPLRWLETNIEPERCGENYIFEKWEWNIVSCSASPHRTLLFINAMLAPVFHAKQLSVVRITASIGVSYNRYKIFDGRNIGHMCNSRRALSSNIYILLHVIWSEHFAGNTHHTWLWGKSGD